MNILLVLLLVCSGLKDVFGQYDGDPCLTDKGVSGTCKFITQCPSAMTGIRTGIIPKICSFEGTKSIVCCTDGYVSTQTTTNTPIKITTRRTTTTTTTASTTTRTTSRSGVTSRLPGEVSNARCIKFARYAYEMEEAPTLPIRSQFSHVLQCAFEKEKLIVGGRKASRQEFPHMAQIGYITGNEVKWGCGGSLISENFVLTAGHCLKSRSLGSPKKVRVGITELTDTNHLQERAVSEIIRHPDYVYEKYHDIALLRVDRFFILEPYVRPACLQTEKNIPYKNAIASGWGKIQYAGEGSTDLLKVVLEIFPTQECNSTYRRDIIQPDSTLKDGIIENLMVCAGSREEFRDTCQGDSGGPLQIYHEDTKDIKCMYTIIGITSFGKSCGLAKNVPGVYTRVSAYIKWIEDNVWP